jgi:antitoxin HicB
MSAKEARSAAELSRLPWSRTVAADENGVYVAAVPELDGCLAEGGTAEDALSNLEEVLQEWLEIAVEDEVDIPPPRLLDDTDFSGRFSVRVPRSLHRELSEWAAQEGASLNQLLVTVLTQAATRRWWRPPGPARSVEDVSEHLAATAVSPASESIAALKGIGSHLRRTGALNLACVLFAAAADRISMLEGRAQASRELGVTAALARRGNHQSLAESLWRASLAYDNDNLRSLSALGQMLHHRGDYAQAIQLLEPAAQRDNYALQFLGWSLLEQGLQDEDEPLVLRGTQTLTTALERWALNNHDESDRTGWVRQVRRLSRSHGRLRETALGLIDFANSHSGWAHVSYDEGLAPNDEGQRASA